MVKTKARLTEGPIFFRLFMFTLPIMLSGLLQVAYNMADSIVVGRFSGDDLALAATGSTASLVTLIVNILMGIATGVSVVIAQHFGAREHERVERATHTAMTFALISGICFAAVSILLSAPALELMGTKPELFDRALLYFRIICLGIPASTVYNFGSSVLRSVGDSRTPLYILFASGLVNVLFNLFFVIVCGMAVDGVAVATIISQYLSAAAVVAVLIIRRRESYGLKWKKLGIDIKLLARFLRFGVPTAISSSVFSVANVLITASANTLPTEALSARTIGGQVDNLVYVAMDAYTHSTMTFVAQNFGAGNLQRIKKTISKKLGLSRKLSQYEEAYIDKWVIDYAYPLDVIEIALKKTTSKTNPSFDYIDKIISDWHERKLSNQTEITEFLNEQKQKRKEFKQQTVNNITPIQKFTDNQTSQYDDLSKFYIN